jgi:hypothetical protein
MASIGTQGPGLRGILRLTWVTDRLAYVLEADAGEGNGTWTGLARPDHGLQIGGDVDNATLLRLRGQAEIADLVWKHPPTSPPSMASSA